MYFYFFEFRLVLGISALTLDYVPNSTGHRANKVSTVPWSCYVIPKLRNPVKKCLVSLNHRRRWSCHLFLLFKHGPCIFNWVKVRGVCWPTQELNLVLLEPF